MFSIMSGGSELYGEPEPAKDQVLAEGEQSQRICPTGGVSHTWSPALHDMLDEQADPPASRG